ncbi:dnaJ homolog subfamily C member 8 isoform X2 [Pseudophryne corroboree]|uniref:dnaJ homolog subfamily C member 8 isoform X2 n=1 Tax=Pseudophryne corroboree TaxID=495146 RepID=UPI00308202D0
MAAPGAEGPSGAVDDAFSTYYTEVKQIEKRDSVLTPKQQIDRLIRPGSSYFNLNPYEVLQLDPEATDEEIKKRFRQLSILVHPDKNQDDPERAQKAFEAVDKAYKRLLDTEQKKRALDVIQAGLEYIEHITAEVPPASLMGSHTGQKAETTIICLAVTSLAQPLCMNPPIHTVHFCRASLLSCHSLCVFSVREVHPSLHGSLLQRSERQHGEHI